MSAALRRLTLATALLAILSGKEGVAGSVLVIGNDAEATDRSLSAVASLGGNYAKAVGFTMAGQSYELSSISLRLMEQAGSSNTLTVELFGGTPSGPSGAPLVRFNTPDIPTTVSNVAFTPTTPFLLRMDTTYWIDVKGTSNTLNGILWYGGTPGFQPTGLATSAGARFSNQANGPSALAASSVMNTFAVNASVADVASVPEPSGLIQVTIAIACGLTYSLWRRG